MERVKSMLAAFFVSIGMIILTVLVVLFCAGMASYVWQNAHSIEEVFPLMGDYTIICLYGFLKWLVKFAGIGIATIVFSYILIHEIGLWLEKYKVRRMSPIEYQITNEGGVGGGMDTPNEQPHELIGEREVSIFRALGIKSYHPNDSGTVKQIFSSIGREIKGTLPEAATELGKILVSKGVCKFDGGKYVLVSNDKPVEIIQQDDTESASEYYERTGQKIGRVNNRGLASEMIKDFPADERKKYLVGVKNSDKNQTENGQN